MSAKPKQKTRKFMTHEPGFDIVRAMETLFARWFDGPSWDAWKTILRAAFALPMSKDEVAFFKTIAGGRDPPKCRVKELWVVGGRRGGKDSIASLIACYAAVFFQAGIDKLRPGERALVQCLACDRDQAKVVLGFTRAFFDHIPPLGAMITRSTANGVELQNDVDIVVATNSFRAVRGRSVLVSIFDEVAFWQSEQTARPDTETYRAVLPSLMTLPGSMLIGISTPHKKSGLLFDRYKKAFGQNDDKVLVIQAASQVLNPTLDAEEIAAAYEDDPSVAGAEYGASWRLDVESFVDPEVVAACIVAGVRELPPVRGLHYVGFCDPSGGSSDSMTLCIAHRQGDNVCIDAIRERRPPFSPDDCVIEFAACLKSYFIGTVRGDRYGGMWPAERFAAHGIRYEPCEQPKSDLYQALLPVLNAKRIDLLDIPRLASQLCSLERKSTRAGKDSIDHAQNAKDDIANAVAGAAALALGHQGVVVTRELLQRVAAMPATRRHTAWGFRRRAALANMVIPRDYSSA